MKNIVSVAACLALCGCATIFSGTTQDVTVKSTPGAKYTVTNTYGAQVANGTVGGDGAATVNLVRGHGYFSPHAYKMKIGKEGYTPETVDIQPGMNGWYFANLAIGGILGMLIIDPITGAMYTMAPTPEEAMLKPSSGETKAENTRKSIIAQARNYPVSKNEYTAMQVAKINHCMPIATPLVTYTSDLKEILTFACEDGRNFSTTCQSNTGCK